MADLVDRARAAVTERAELPGMSLLEHLAELRRRIIHTALYLIGIGVSYIVHPAARKRRAEKKAP